LKDAGASAAVLEAIKQARTAGPSADKRHTVTYQNVLELLRAGVDETVIRKRLETSPTLFTLDESQVDELKKAGASENLLATLQTKKSGVNSPGDVTDLVLILDCSGSMIDKTSDGLTKMQVAQDVVTDLITRYPDGRRLCFIVYGHNKEQRCNAVKVVQGL